MATTLWASTARFACLASTVTPREAWRTTADSVSVVRVSSESPRPFCRTWSMITVYGSSMRTSLSDAACIRTTYRTVHSTLTLPPVSAPPAGLFWAALTSSVRTVTMAWVDHAVTSARAVSTPTPLTRPRAAPVSVTPSAQSASNVTHAVSARASRESWVPSAISVRHVTPSSTSAVSRACTAARASCSKKSTPSLISSR